MIRIDRLDHLVLTVASIEKTCAFYERVLGMRAETFGAGRTALRFGAQKINLHRRGREFEPKARLARPGTADLCFIADTPIEAVVAHLAAERVPIEEGPVQRTGAAGTLVSVYIRDPDGNLIELSNVVAEEPAVPALAGRKLPVAALGTGAAGALALGATALGALAVGALAIGALAVGRVSVGRARIRRLEIDELVVRRTGDPDGG